MAEKDNEETNISDIPTYKTDIEYESMDVITYIEQYNEYYTYIG